MSSSTMVKVFSNSSCPQRDGCLPHVVVVKTHVKYTEISSVLFKLKKKIVCRYLGVPNMNQKKLSQNQYQ